MEPVKLKDTLNLPVTSFPMRGNLPETEPKRIAQWESEELYKKILNKNIEAGKNFSMPDGPPYANGNLHLGHVLNKVLKDIVIKYKGLKGYQSVFIPGWDCHGLPIEHKVSKELGPKRKDKSKAEIRELCRTEAKKWVGIQGDQFRRLGILADWENPYLTLSADYEAEEVRELSKVMRRGLLYRGKKPVFWCPALQTALADAEVEYLDHESPSIYVKFPLTPESQGELFAEIEEPVNAVIWTTTPWTLPANLGISFHPDFEYGVYPSSAGNLILAKDLAEKFSEEVGVELGSSIKTLKGSEFENKEAQHPFLERKSLFLLGNHVTLDAGTGLVHTAPGHGMDDYLVGLRYGLDVFCPVGPDGRYTDEFSEMAGEKIFDANKKIINKLVASNHMIFYKFFTHSYPHNWRSKTPLIYRATPQWFLSVDHEEYKLREKALELTENGIEFFPAWGKARMEGMLKNRPDWCLSRQRTWGVPIPALSCNHCHETYATPEFMEKVADFMEESGKGIEAYFEGDLSDLAPATCPSCGKEASFCKEQDILDVWFDSGVCHAAVQRKREGLEFPADIYLEGSDQHRGWFQTSLVSALASRGEAPFKALVTHGFVNDAQGKKMSKSLGNTIDPLKVIKRSGAEILRLWVAYEDYGQDVNVGEEIFSRVTETYRRIRNTIRFIHGNLNGFDPETDKVPLEDLDPLDRWAIHKVNELVKKCDASYESFDFYKVYHALNIFFTVDLSARYLDILKDRMYVEHKTSKLRRSSQTALHEILQTTISLMAPILSFLAEEAYSYLPGEKKESVFLDNFPEYSEEKNSIEISEQYEKLFEVRSLISKSIEEMRNDKKIRGSLEAKIRLGTKFKKDIEGFDLRSLEEFFIVSKVEISDEIDDYEVGLAEGEKCPRCWHIDELIPTPSGHEVCPRCAEVLGQI